MITTFSSFNDGLAPHQRNREHFLADIDLEDGPHWIPYVDGVWVQPCLFNLTSGGTTVVLKALPGVSLGTHYHTGIVQGFTLRGHWRYLEHDFIAKPGSYIYEPAGEAHTLIILDDSPEPAVIFFAIQGGLIYLNTPANGNLVAYEDAFSALEMTRTHYREHGLDVSKVDGLIR
jgi:quercetin dioxygenase-like cupin family protein